MSKPFRRSLSLRLLRGLGLLALCLFLLTWLPVLILRFVPPFTSAVMLERHVGAWVRHEKNFHLHQHWVPWRDVSLQVPLAMVAGEDQTFPYNHGFDFRSIHKAINAADDGKRLRGASTLTQQTAKNLFLWNGRSFLRKGLEAYFTVLIDLTWPKRRVLEMYMNIAELGDGIYGIGAASDAYFHMAPAKISATQAARLAAVLPSPRRMHVDRPSAYVLSRTDWIERQMRHLGGTGYIDGHAPDRPPH